MSFGHSITILKSRQLIPRRDNLGRQIIMKESEMNGLEGNFVLLNLIFSYSLEFELGSTLVRSCLCLQDIEELSFLVSLKQ